MKKLLFLLPILLIVIGCGEPTAPDNKPPVITAFTVSPKVIKTCPTNYCSDGLYSVVNCVAVDPEGDTVYYSFRVEPVTAGVNQPDPMNGIGIFESANEGQFAITCKACDDMQGGDCSTAGLFIKVCDNCGV